MTPSALRPLLRWLAPTALACTVTALQDDRPAHAPEEPSVHVEYLELVTPDVDATVRSLEALHGVHFSEPVATLGGARTAPLAGGGRLGVRAPMHAAETPVVRPYLLVPDLDAAAKTATERGATLAVEPTPLPELGAFSIYLRGGLELGLWKK